tara:strand:- start:6716 stop:7420 length:705 start_codon:yes stop_codon:yes gene_type:complete
MKFINVLERTDHSVDETLIVNEVVSGKVVTFANFFSYLKSRDIDGSYIDRVYMDGIAGVVLLKIMGIRAKRHSMDYTSIANPLFSFCIENSLRLGVVATTEKLLGSAVDNIIGKYPGLNIGYKRNGFFSDDRQKLDVIREICNSHVDVVVVGMGAPYQDEFCSLLKINGFKGGCITCGGFIEQISGGDEFYPRWVNKLNLRAFYRMFDKPELIKRYFLNYPVGAYHLIKDLGGK